MTGANGQPTVAAVERELKLLHATMDRRVQAARREAADRTWMLALTATLLVLGVMPWFIESGPSRVLSPWLNLDESDAAGTRLVLTVTVLIVVAGSAVVARVRPVNPRPHWLLAALAFLIVAIGVFAAWTLGEEGGAGITPAFVVGMAVAFVLAIEHVRQAALT